MVAEEITTTSFRLGENTCPSCGSSKRWEPNAGIVEPNKIRVHCDCGLGILEIELVK